MQDKKYIWLSQLPVTKLFVIVTFIFHDIFGLLTIYFNLNSELNGFHTTFPLPTYFLGNLITFLKTVLTKLNLADLIRIYLLFHSHDESRADPDQAALVRAAWSGSTLFAHGYMVYLTLNKKTWQVISLFYVPKWKFIYIIIHSGKNIARIFMKQMVNKCS